jgi:hypothetical protein
MLTSRNNALEGYHFAQVLGTHGSWVKMVVTETASKANLEVFSCYRVLGLIV